MPRPIRPRALLPLLLALSSASCASRSPAPLTIVSQPPPPPVSQAEAELFELPARPTLDPGNDGDWRDLGPRLLALDLKQDAALKVCKVSHDNLLSVVTKPAQVKP